MLPPLFLLLHPPTLPQQLLHRRRRLSCRFLRHLRPSCQSAPQPQLLLPRQLPRRLPHPSPSPSPRLSLLPPLRLLMRLPRPMRPRNRNLLLPVPVAVRLPALPMPRTSRRSQRVRFCVA